MQARLLLAWQSEDTISFQDLEDADFPRGTISGQHELSAHSQRHLSKVVLKSLLDAITHNPGSKPEAVVVPLLRTHASIISGSGPDAAVTFMAIPSDPRSTNHASMQGKRDGEQRGRQVPLDSCGGSAQDRRNKDARLGAALAPPREPTYRVLCGAG